MLVKTLAQSSDRVISLANIAGEIIGTNPRHPLADNYLMINDSHRMMRTFVYGKGFRQYGQPTTIGNGPAAPETNETYGIVDYPINVVGLYGFDVLYNGLWYSLEQIDWEERRSYQCVGSTPYLPSYFSVRSIGTVATATEAIGSIAFFPFVANITYRLHVQLEWADISNVSHKFIFAEQCWYDLMIYDAVWKIAVIRDQNKAGRAGMVAEGIKNAKELIGTYLPQMAKTGPMTQRRSANYRAR